MGATDAATCAHTDGSPGNIRCFFVSPTALSALLGGGPHRAIPTGSARMERVRGGRSNRNWVTLLNVSKISSFC